MNRKLMIAGLLLCLCGAERAVAQYVPGAIPAGMNRDTLFGNRNQSLHDRLNDAENTVNRCRDDMNRRNDELRRDNERRGYNHTTGQRRGPDGVENDYQYSKLAKKYDDAVRTRDGLKGQLPPDVNRVLDAINQITKRYPPGGGDNRGSNVPRNADTNPK